MNPLTFSPSDLLEDPNVPEVEPVKPFNPEQLREYSSQLEANPLYQHYLTQLNSFATSLVQSIQEDTQNNTNTTFKLLGISLGVLELGKMHEETKQEIAEYVKENNQ